MGPGRSGPSDPLLPVDRRARDGRERRAQLARAAAVAAQLGQADRLEPATLRLRGAYAGLGALYAPDREPRSGDAELDAWMAARLEPDDGLLVVGRLGLVTLLRRLARGRRT